MGRYRDVCRYFNSIFGRWCDCFRAEFANELGGEKVVWQMEWKGGVQDKAPYFHGNCNLDNLLDYCLDFFVSDSADRRKLGRIRRADTGLFQFYFGCADETSK